MQRRPWLSLVLIAGGLVFLLASACSTPRSWQPEYDLIVERGTVYDGLGNPPKVTDIGVRANRVETLGDLSHAFSLRRVDAGGLAVAPGFVNMLSWAVDALWVDGRSESDIRQGVTLEVFGEGWSMGPLNARLQKEMLEQQAYIKYPITWASLKQWMKQLERRRVACNIASYVGASTVRQYVIGNDQRDATPQELEQMQELVRQAMKEGALGVGSALIYAPGSYADTKELIALMQAAAPYGGRYISHMRSEGDRLLEAIDELIQIARESKAPAEIYHLKAAGRANWGKLDAAIEKIEAARREGLKITADMYTYTAGATGLDAAMPTSIQSGGYLKWRERLLDPKVRAETIEAMRAPGKDWENLYFHAGAEGTLLLGFKNEKLSPLIGKTLAQVAKERGKSPEDTAIDLVIEDGSRVEVAYFLMSEENLQKQIRLPWVSFCSDAASQSPEGDFLKMSTHPRAYGNFARLLGKYVREEKLIPLEEAIRRLTSLPADNLGMPDRGRIAEGAYADLVVFDPNTIADRATYEQPQQFAVGVKHVFVNGVQVLDDGKLTGARPGWMVRPIIEKR